ncbi:hypothetical protein [Dethiobacter alkaliphilus]|uniref:Uncharacterized protein n=1 Tax=Dethiobacter alkaliphilus AHT 1 TaxID=555088 RepID=C0GD28_DETAL|nr:hypothetical protein [Dethiobacter alkaliphilus]EEG79113.1 hypothetical protein DealDRAFT_0387 [Dethiobacter alkaliphilus AHT 1]
MPTLRNMIVEFNESLYWEKRAQGLLVGEEEFSLLNQEEISEILDKNIIKSTNKDLLNPQIAEAIAASFEKIKKVDHKVLAKEVYQEFVDYLAGKYGFNIDISDTTSTIIGSPEERWVYLLRETERSEHGQGSMKITEIADKLGCSKRSLELDIKRITLTGFKLLGQNIKLVDEENSVLNMQSTPHPIVLMQNISQILVLLEGLRAMEKVQAYSTFAHYTAINIWNQLTEYAQNKILDALELMGQDANIDWYLNLSSDSNMVNRFLSETKMSETDPMSQLMYLAKNQMPFNLTYQDEKGQQAELQDCTVSFFNPVASEIRLSTPLGEHHLREVKILEIEILT